MTNSATTPTLDRGYKNHLDLFAGLQPQTKICTYYLKAWEIICVRA